MKLWWAIVALVFTQISAFGNLPDKVEELFYCTDGQAGYDLYLKPDKSLIVSPKQNPSQIPGTYELANDQIQLSIPSAGFNETSTQLEQGKGLILVFKTASLFCHAVGHTLGPAVEAYAKCPTIKYIPNIGYEDNAFEFFGNRMVKRRRWKELTMGNDTLYSESFGIYYIEGDQLWMVFGDREDEQLLTATIHPDHSFTINELEPDKGACKAQ